MNSILVTILGFYTLILIGGIYYYEDKFNRLDRDYKDLEQEFFEVYTQLVDANNGCEIPADLIEKNARLEEELELHKAMANSNHNAITHQMDVNEMMDKQNFALQEQIKALKMKNAELKAMAGEWQRAYQSNKPIEYNYTSWQPSNYNSVYENQSLWQDELDLDQ